MERKERCGGQSEVFIFWVCGNWRFGLFWMGFDLI